MKKSIKSLGCIVSFLLFNMASLSVYGLQLSGAYVREMPPGIAVTALFGTLYNDQSAPIKLIGAKLTGAAKVEFHQHTLVDGVMKMRRLNDGIVIAGKQSLVLKPGSYHLMVFGMKSRISAETMKLQLISETGETYDFPVSFKSSSSMMGSHTHRN